MKKMIFSIALMTLVAFTSGVMAQQKPAPAKPAATPTPAPVQVEKFIGMIEKVDEMAKAIVVKGKVKKEEKTLTFVIDDKTKIQKGGKDVPFADLKKEMQVSVEYKKEGEKMVATMIKVAAPAHHSGLQLEGGDEILASGLMACIQRERVVISRLGKSGKVHGPGIPL